MLASMLSVSNSSVFTPALLKTQSCFLCYPRKPQNVSQSFHLKGIKMHFFFLSVQLSQLYIATDHTSAFISCIFLEIGML